MVFDDVSDVEREVVVKKVIISANVLFTISNFRKDFIKFLKEKRFDVVCVASKDELSSNSEKVLNDLDVRFVNISINRKGLNPLDDLKYIFELYSIYKREKADFIFHFTIKPNIYGTIVAKLVGSKSINTINGLGSAIIKNSFLSKILKLMYKFSLKFSSKVFFQNSDDLDFFINNNLVCRDKVDLVPGSGVDTDFFKDCKSQSKTLTFILVARLIKDKGIYEYVEAARKLKAKNSNVTFLLGGPIDYGNPSSVDENEVKRWNKEGVVKYIGKTDSIKDFLCRADIVVLPSYREGMSRFLIESASASKPIVTTDVAGCKDIVENGCNGFLCEPNSISSLEEAMQKMIDLDRNEIEKMGKKSNKIAKDKFDKDIINDIYLQEIL